MSTSTRTVALVTGAASGIGKAIAQRLVEDDVTVILADRGVIEAVQLPLEISNAVAPAPTFAPGPADTTRLSLAVAEAAHAVHGGAIHA